MREAVVLCLILAVAGWLLAASRALRLHFANDTIRMLRANAFAITPEERQAVEWAIFEYGATHPDHGMAAQRAATLRGLLERTK
jgi:hypothetical protein